VIENKLEIAMLRYARVLTLGVLTLVVTSLLIFSGYQSASAAQAMDSSLFKQLKFRSIGPPGNRVSAVYGIPGDPNVYYAGTPTGGIFKTTDAGTTWFPIFDDQKDPFIGALAVAASDPKIVWAGTGETWFRNNNLYVPIGDGVYKSINGGKTWIHSGLERTGHIGRIVIDPQDPNIVFVAAMGVSYGPQQERGVFRTKDGGKTWERVLFVDPNTGCADIAMDPHNSKTLFAGMWQTWAEESGGPGSGLYVSRDGGDTWKKLSGHGLPGSPVGKVGIAIAPSNSKRIYVLIETGGGKIFRGQKTSSGILWVSNDGGENWKLTSYDRDLIGRSHYYVRAAVSPDNPDKIFFTAAKLSMSTDGGKSIKSVGRTELHGDHHDLWIDPTNGNRIIESNDGGMGISVNGGKTWQQINLPNAQVYHVTVDNQVPYNVYGNEQDMGSTRGPSNSRERGIPLGAWRAVGGGEAGIAVPDPIDNNIIWSTGHPSGSLDRYDERTRQIREVGVWPDDTWGWADKDLKYRFQRTFPLIISPFDRNRIYVGSQYVHMTTDGGNSWKIISPDLTTNDKSRQQSMDSLTPMNSGTENCVIFALAESPLKEGVIWAGTNDGQVQVTLDGGAHWNNVTRNIHNLPPWGIVSNIVASRYDPGTAYITINLNEQNIRNAYVYKTTDYGRSWRSLSATLPTSDTLSVDARFIAEDPVRRGLLFLGTEDALYVSFNDGAKWLSLNTNLPQTPVHGVVVQKQFDDLVVATYGRGFWILDDITPLQQLTPEVLESEVHLFKPRPAYRFQEVQPPEMLLERPSVGENPPDGASINYFLRTGGVSKVTVRISDEKGQTIRTLDGADDRGINRVWWDIRYEPTAEPILRTKPLGAPWFKLGPDNTRRFPEAKQGRISILAPPGKYTVTLFVGGKVMRQTLEVLKDPNTTGSEADVMAQTRLLLRVRDDINTVVRMIDRLEATRRQIYDLEDVVKHDGNARKPVLLAARRLDQRIISVERHLYVMTGTGKGQDDTFMPSELLERLLSLVPYVASADFPPTTQDEQLYESLRNLRDGSLSEFKGLREKDVPAFNELLEKAGLHQTVGLGEL
jgi:photosystem II stability/assembly factor-like uncharacterized protein